MVLEFDPEEVEEVLRVTAMALAFPSLTPEPWSSSNRRPITGVCENHRKIGKYVVVYISRAFTVIHQLFYLFISETG